MLLIRIKIYYNLDKEEAKMKKASSKVIVCFIAYNILFLMLVFLPNPVNPKLVENLRKEYRLYEENLLISEQSLDYNLEVYRDEWIGKLHVLAYKSDTYEPNLVVTQPIEFSRNVDFGIIRIEEDRYLLIFIVNEPGAFYFDFMTIKKGKLNQWNDIYFYTAIIDESMMSQRYYTIYDKDFNILVEFK